jgi:hypothetical protein
MTVSTVPALPIELINSILLYCPRFTWITVSYVNSIYYEAATRLLYRDLVIDHWMVGTVKLFKTLIGKPALAAHVRSIIFVNQALFRQYTLVSMRTLLMKCLRSINGLLAFYTGLPGSCERLFGGCRFSLHTAHVRFNLDAALEKWLDSQSQIKDLAIFKEAMARGLGPFSLQPTSLPHLVKLRAPWPFIARIAPGRPIVIADIRYETPDDRIYTEAIPALAHTSAQLYRLKLNGPGLDLLRIFTAISRSAPDVFHLEVRVTRLDVVSLSYTPLSCSKRPTGCSSL